MQPGILARVLTLWMHVPTLGEGGSWGWGRGWSWALQDRAGELMKGPDLR